MLTRREFHKGLVGFALASIATRQSVKAETPPEDEATFFLNRLTYGATRQSRSEFREAGLENWLNTQLSLPARDPALEDRIRSTRLLIEYEAGRTEDGETWPALSEHRPISLLDKDPADLLYLLDFDKPIAFSERERPANEVIAASLVRAVHATAQLREVMTAFWHEHFSVNALKSELTAVFFPEYDRGMRENAFGNFRRLLGHVAKSPSMLAYLNNDESRASPANENYARELMELHTLGAENYFNDKYQNWKDVPGVKAGLAEGYIEQDVYEVARALTGWSIGDGRELDENTYAPETGRFAYFESWHDPYQKRVLGRELPANSAPLKDGETVLDILAAHPGTAHFVSGKLLRALGVEAPSSTYLGAIAKVFHDARDAEDQIAQTIRAIVLHSEYTATPAGKLRRPFEFVAALFRATEAQVSPRSDAIYWELARAGWTQHQVRPPTGHSDRTRDWANTHAISGTVSLALGAHAEWMDASDPVLRRLPETVTVYQDLAHYWGDRFGLPAPDMQALFDLYDIDPDEEIDPDPDSVEWINEAMVAALSLTPEFLFR